MSDLQLNPLVYRGTITIPTSDTVSTGTQTLTEAQACRTHHLIFTTPDMQDTDSTAMSIVNASNETFFSSGTKAESTTTSVGSQVILISGDKVIMTAEGTQQAARAITYEIRGQR